MGTGKRPDRTLLSDEELRERLLADPEAQARIRDAVAAAKEGNPDDPGITIAELPDFLREHG